MLRILLVILFAYPLLSHAWYDAQYHEQKAFSYHSLPMSYGSISSDEAASIAQSSYPSSRVLSVVKRGDVYKVKILSEGHVRMVVVDSQTGEILN